MVLGSRRAGTTCAECWIMCDIIISPEQTLVLSAYCCIPHFYGLYETQSANNKWNFKEKEKGNFPLHLRRLSEALRNPPPVFPALWLKETAKVHWTHSLHAIPCRRSAEMWGLAADVKAGSWNSSHHKRITVEELSALLVPRKGWWTCFQINYAGIMHAKPSNEREHSKSTSQGLGPNSV